MAGREDLGMRIKALLLQNVPEEGSLCLGYP